MLFEAAPAVSSTPVDVRTQGGSDGMEAEATSRLETYVAQNKEDFPDVVLPY